MKNFCYVYWAHLKEHTDIFSEGYVGFTSRTPEERLREHIQESGHPNKNLTHFHRALKKYKDDIVLDTVCISTEKYCLDVEYRLRPKDRVGWNPLEDDEYKAWKSGSCTGGATGSSGNSSDMNSDNKA